MHFRLTPSLGEGSAKAPRLPVRPFPERKIMYVAVTETLGEPAQPHEEYPRCSALPYTAGSD